MKISMKKENSAKANNNALSRVPEAQHRALSKQLLGGIYRTDYIIWHVEFKSFQPEPVIAKVAGTEVDLFVYDATVALEGAANSPYMRKWMENVAAPAETIIKGDYEVITENVNFKGRKSVLATEFAKTKFSFTPADVNSCKIAYNTFWKEMANTGYDIVFDELSNQYLVIDSETVGYRGVIYTPTNKRETTRLFSSRDRDSLLSDIFAVAGKTAETMYKKAIKETIDSNTKENKIWDQLAQRIGNFLAPSLKVGSINLDEECVLLVEGKLQNESDFSEEIIDQMHDSPDADVWDGLQISSQEWIGDIFQKYMNEEGFTVNKQLNSSKLKIDLAVVLMETLAAAGPGVSTVDSNDKTQVYSAIQAFLGNVEIIPERKKSMNIAFNKMLNACSMQDVLSIFEGKLDEIVDRKVAIAVIQTKLEDIYKLYVQEDKDDEDKEKEDAEKKRIKKVCMDNMQIINTGLLKTSGNYHKAAKSMAPQLRTSELFSKTFNNSVSKEVLLSIVKTIIKKYPKTFKVVGCESLPEEERLSKIVTIFDSNAAKFLAEFIDLNAARSIDVFLLDIAKGSESRFSSQVATKLDILSDKDIKKLKLEKAKLIEIINFAEGSQLIRKTDNPVNKNDIDITDVDKISIEGIKGFSKIKKVLNDVGVKNNCSKIINIIKSTALFEQAVVENVDIKLNLVNSNSVLEDRFELNKNLVKAALLNRAAGNSDYYGAVTNSSSIMRQTVKQLSKIGQAAVSQMSFDVDSLFQRATFDISKLIADVNLLGVSDGSLEVYSVDHEINKSQRADKFLMRIENYKAMVESIKNKNSENYEAVTDAADIEWLKVLINEAYAGLQNINTALLIKYPSTGFRETEKIKFVSRDELNNRVDTLISKKEISKEEGAHIKEYLFFAEYGTAIFGCSNTVKHRLAGFDIDYDGVAFIYEWYIINSYRLTTNGAKPLVFFK